jgi:hypothetical protein
MEKSFDNMFPEDNRGPGSEKYPVEPIDDYIIAYIESIFDKPITELLTYGADLTEIAAYIFKTIAVCECSYELQCLVFDLFPRWYIAQTPFRGEIYPDAPIDWDIWIKHWEHLATFLEGKTH